MMERQIRWRRREVTNLTGLLIHYRDAYFEESRQVVGASSAVSGRPRGLVGRQVANAEMLQAMVRHGHDPTLTFLVQGDRDAASLKDFLQRDLPSHKSAVIKRFETLPKWIAELGECVLWQPQPPSAMFAWMRQRYQARKVAIGGITHSLCSAIAIHAIKDLVAAPVTGVDRLVCTSDAVGHTARSVIEHASKLSGRAFDPDQIELETIPLGVDCERHRPASPQQRCEVRERLGIDDQTNAFLFVGRLLIMPRAIQCPCLLVVNVPVSGPAKRSRWCWQDGMPTRRSKKRSKAKRGDWLPACGSSTSTGWIRNGESRFGRRPTSLSHSPIVCKKRSD